MKMCVYFLLSFLRGGGKLTSIFDRSLYDPSPVSVVLQAGGGAGVGCHGAQELTQVAGGGGGGGGGQIRR